MPKGNPTRWRQIYIPEELSKDLEDVALQSGLGLNEAATMLIIAGAHAIFQRDSATKDAAESTIDPPREADATGTGLRPEPATPTSEQG